MSAFGLFSSIDQVNHAARLEGESYMALFGSVSVDFTRERLAPGDHTIAVTALFGSVKLVFPADVEVRTEGLQVFGSSELKDLREGAARAASDTRVTVQATAAFGSVEVVRSGVPTTASGEPYQLADAGSYDEGAAGEPRAYEGVTRKIGRDE